MKKLLPLITVLLLLSSCEFLENLFNGSENDPTESIEIALETICNTREKEDGLNSLIYSIDQGITDRSEIESIKYTFTYSTGGANGIEVNLETGNSLIKTNDEVTYNTRNTISRDIIVSSRIENLSGQGDNTPLGIAEIIIDMPGGGIDILSQKRKVNFQNELESAIVRVDEVDCCKSISTSLTNVIVSLKGGSKKDIRLPGCFKIFDIGSCCELNKK